MGQEVTTDPKINIEKTQLIIYAMGMFNST